MRLLPFKNLFCGLMLLLVINQTTNACPFCSAPSLTLTEQLEQADGAALVQWIAAIKPGESDAGTTEYEVVQTVKSKEAGMKQGDRVTLSRYRKGSKGELFLLLGEMDKELDWGSPMEITETGYQYLIQAPSTELDTTKRLEYFLQFLEFPDPLISNDAYGEFANAPYEDITPLADQMPRDRLRKWVASDDTAASRLGLYGLLLGLCGKQDDVEIMKRKIVEPTQDFRLGIDGVMSGYLLLTGEKGLALLDRLKLESTVMIDEQGKPILDSDGKEQPVPFSETYAAMQALRFMWQYEAGRIEKERLRKSMRLLLSRSELADLVIADLARWQDWSVMERLMKLYDDEAYNVPSIKRSIIRYMLQSTKDKPEDATAELPAHVIAGRKNVEILRKKDPQTVKDTERFFFIQ